MSSLLEVCDVMCDVWWVKCGFWCLVCDVWRVILCSGHEGGATERGDIACG